MGFQFELIEASYDLVSMLLSRFNIAKRCGCMANRWSISDFHFVSVKKDEWKV